MDRSKGALMVAKPTELAIRFFATGFGAGRVPVAPGTAGTLVAIPLFLLLREIGWPAYALSVAAMFLFGVWLCGRAEKVMGRKDNPQIVWDEIVGYLVSMFGTPPGWIWIVIGFLLFRLFDIVKPFPIRTFERRIPGGLGVMMDDVLAGVYVLALLHVLRYVYDVSYLDYSLIY
jgi:phosphatidylglycerophosphatase A